MSNPCRAASFRSIDVEAILRCAAGRRLVVIAPHPDDETLGCGRLIAHAMRRGTEVAVIVLTDGDASHPRSKRWPPAALGRLRIAELKRSMARLGASNAPLRRLGWSDSQVLEHGKAIQLSRHLVALKAGVVLVTSDADHHPDHKAAFTLASLATCRLGLPLIRYAVWSRADRAVRVAGRYRAVKRWAIAAHRSQVGGYIADDPAGFRLSSTAMANLVGGREQFR
ncbi:PIG-L deacetylase family protein [Glacieibacterium frigidum]|uniref:PIG-L deacetylase family protein n=1 Tax=Glacieibacterium frigidum TaxID=2593303 RepID=UPI00163D847F|nr:PIG-L family deacetylase [Glacieibacterium frigidum]